MPSKYDFLNDYLQRVEMESVKADQQTSIEDDNSEFFNTFGDGFDDTSEAGIINAVSDPEEDVQYQEDTTMNEAENDPDYFDTMGNSDEPDYQFDDSQSPYIQAEMTDTPESFIGGSGGENGGGGKVSGLGERIAKTESDGDYKATNKHSSAAGKYQFLWGDWGDSIKKITGVKSKQDFLNNPKAQDKYFAWYEKHYLAPEISKLQSYNKAKLSDEQLMRLVHFRGAAGAKKYLQGKLKDKPESYNIPISKYIGKKQTGGYAGMKYQTGGEPENVRVAGFEDMPLYVPEDTKKKIKLIDNRKINPATGKSFKNIGQNSIDADPEYISAIIAHAKAKGVDPYTALSIAYQESNIGQYDNAGQVLGSYWKGIPDDWSDANKDAAALVTALKDKLKYAKSLGYSKKGEAYALQAYQGYGNLYPDTEVLPGKKPNSAYFGIPVSKDRPLNLKKNPAYGKTVISLRDSILKKNPEINKLIKETQPFVYQTGGYTQVARTRQEQYDGLNDPNHDEMIFPLYGENEFRGLDNGEPVYIEDETGKKKVLKGNNQKITMKGKVFEKRLK